ncbi:hypothetical protein SAMN02745866_03326 [Alteromonadaceae bacterium Bs31]|nr:hypothetical protein SAMN02745866_03326 [Alteromonadaceae bacterium Bs31]
MNALIKTLLSGGLTLLITACGGGGDNKPLIAENLGPGNPTISPSSPDRTGWTDFKKLLVASDGSLSLGDPNGVNETRDTGSKIVFFNAAQGNNEQAEVYWWNGENIIDATGSSTNSNGDEYGVNPLKPNENAIKAFANMADSANDERLKTHQTTDRDWFVEGLAGGFPDWFLFKRGQIHSEFNSYLLGGRSEQEPMLVAGYGEESEGRAVFEVGSAFNPLLTHNYGKTINWIHTHLFSIEFRRMRISLLGTSKAESRNGEGPVSFVMEDCKMFNPNGNALTYLPQKSTIYRSIVSHSWHGDPGHVQGYYGSGAKAQVTFEDMIFYKNGFKEDPLTNADPRRDIFSRNIYQGGGARMGHIYRGIISADGGSGGPQMRYGGLLENSLIIEGYFYSSTSSNNENGNNPTEWLEAEGQAGQSAQVKNNVQFIFENGSPEDPDNPETDLRSQPGWGYSLSGASYGSMVSGNIISAAMLIDDLGGTAGAATGIKISSSPYEFYADGVPVTYAQKDNQIINNIIYRTRFGIAVSGDATDIRNIEIKDNIVVSFDDPLRNSAESLSASSQLLLEDNTFYSPEALLEEPWIGSNQHIRSEDLTDAVSTAKTAENWPDPDRTLKRYVSEELGLTLLDWADDQNIPQSQKNERIAAGEAYDPSGMKTFMAVAVNMRFGGKSAAPSSGKPALNGDYAWDERYTGQAVVNWVRAGFGQASTKLSEAPAE